MIVIDCSAAINVALERPGSETLSSLVNSGEHIIAPDLFVYEVNSALKKYVDAGYFDAKSACERYGKALEIVDELVEPRSFDEDVLAESLRLDHSPYDVAYLLLAKRKGATLMTLDRKLAALCAKEGVECVTTAA